MDLYDDLDSFIEAYLCSDASPREIPQQRGHSSKKSEKSDQDLYDLNKLVECEFSGHVQETLTPVHRQVIHKTTELKPRNSTLETGRHNFDQAGKCNCTRVKTIQALSCCQCPFKCSDLNEMRCHHLNFHVQSTSNECNGYLNQLGYGPRK